MSEPYHTTNMYYQKSGTKTCKNEEEKKRIEPKTTLIEVQDLTTSLQNHFCKVGAFNSTYSTFTSTYTTQVKYLYYRLVIDRY